VVASSEVAPPFLSIPEGAAHVFDMAHPDRTLPRIVGGTFTFKAHTAQELA
jgi:hypothetical protein